ncbi:hypothetical protein A3B87_01345 [Candidatus Kuenenbacteria bacterium RIFCSPHIGHO2_02_FULL_39_13]|uniref:Uncharacterized protein n=1 Tax=Candidatus Kuenenbacteria bacterium RIFCSPHIGHO2_02_FULL_39_13 TaxID=1798561 RepID=A0A1F6FND3_9BACT|nr:MAG: hypothetical protein A3B87_01345 [Candidatus Kuenenbacteria bacterium RIFCSPHIGHO2_02_FULL_39_13]
MKNLLKLSYWFNPNPGQWIEGNLKIVYAVFVLLIVVGLIAWLFVGKNKDNKLMAKFWQRVKNACLTVGIIGLALIFCRQQRIYFLSMPFLILLNAVGGIVWAYFIARYIFKTVPEKKREIAEKKEKEKYLP